MNTIKCGHLVLHGEEGRYVGWVSALSLIVEPYEEGWIWQALPVFSGSHVFVDAQHAAENMLVFMKVHKDELETMFGDVVGLGDMFDAV